MSRNKKIAEILYDMARIYRYMGDKQVFRAVAYENAARTLSGLESDVAGVSESELAEMKDIGTNIAKKVREFVDTGRIEKFEELRSAVPFELVKLQDVKGLGPKSLKKIHEAYGVETRDELMEALNDGRVARLDGFGEKKVENIRKGLASFTELEERIRLWDALRISREIQRELEALEGIRAIEVAGSLRRRKETIGDIDILVAAEQDHVSAIMDRFTAMEGVREVIARGETKSSITIEEKERRVDLRIVDPEAWGAALLYFTGSKEHNVQLRGIANEQGMKLSEYGVFEESTGKRIASGTEAEVYEALGMHWVAPEMREDRGEVEAARKGTLPELIKTEDILGDLHMHSDWTDGVLSIQEIVDHVRTHHAYRYIALTDHSKAVRVAGGLSDEQVREQIGAVGAVNRELGTDLIKTGIEVDILQDGTLDLPDDILERLDWVVASVHQGMNGDNTERLIKACEHPAVRVIGHPTGRLLGSREGYSLDMEKVVEAAVRTGTALEINAQPSRLDLSDRAARYAAEKGAKLVISTDAHGPLNFQFMELGVATARRAWCTPEQVLNCWSWEQVQGHKPAVLRAGG